MCRRQAIKKLIRTIAVYLAVIMMVVGGTTIVTGLAMEFATGHFHHELYALAWASFGLLMVAFVVGYALSDRRT